MNFKQVLVSELKPADYNPRKKLQPKDPEYQRIKKSIEEFGYVDPIIVNSDYTVIGGHQRLAVLKELGHSKIDVVVVDLPKTKEKALNVALNKITGEWDFTQLSIVLSELKEEDFDISITGFSDKELKDIDEELFGKQIKDDDYEPPPEIKTTIKRGDIITLGRHRVMCGDSTSKEDVERLMDGKKADMVFTDPPYGIGKDIENDDLSYDALQKWNEKWLNILPINGDCGFICYHSTRTFPAVLIPALNKAWTFERMLWFTRPDKFPVNTWKGWMLVSQVILLFSKGKVTYQKVTPADQDCYKHTAKELGEPSGHPTEKIVGHIAKVIQHFSAPLIYDPFLGSGTTLIACEQLNRICYGMEISPQYCEVICQRWEKYTGQKRVIQEGA